jgi:outer membrane protein assembly factor BamD (BamD/ComL family)
MGELLPLKRRLQNLGVHKVKGWHFEKRGKNLEEGNYTNDAKLRLLTGFVMQFPEFKEMARPILDDALYASLRDGETDELLQEYMVAFPDGKHKNEVSREVERRTFDSAEKAGKAALESFLVKYPESSLKTGALTRIEWYDLEEAKSKKSIPIMEAYIQAHASGVTVEAAQSELDILRFAVAREAGTVQAYKEFINSYPINHYRDDARKAIAAIESGQDFPGVKKLNTADAYEAFLKKYPSSPFEDEAHARLTFIMARKSTALGDCEEFFRLYHSGNDLSNLHKEYALILEIVLKQAASSAQAGKGGARAHLILYKESHDDRLLAQAWELAEDVSEEIFILNNINEEGKKKIFRLVPLPEDPSAARFDQDYPWPLGNSRITAEPRVKAVLVSLAKRGKYRVTVEAAMEVGYKKYFYGITWIAPDYAQRQWTKIYTASSTVVIPSQGRSGVIEFSFPKIEVSSQAGVPGYSFNTEMTSSETDYRIVSIEPM